MVGKELTLCSSSKASWQHSQYPFLLLGTVQAADRRLGSWSLASLGRIQGGGKWSLLESSERTAALWPGVQASGERGTKMARVGHRLACLQLAPLVQGGQERQQGRRGLSVSTPS